MRKLFFLFFLTILPLAASADPVEIGGLYYNLSTGETNTAELTSGSTMYSGNVVIPASVTYNEVPYSVTSIGNHAFFLCR